MTISGASESSAAAAAGASQGGNVVTSIVVDASGDLLPVGGGGSVPRPPPEANYWGRTTVTEGQMRVLESQSIIPPQVTSGWRVPREDPWPIEKDGECVVFTSFYERRGLGLPLCPFMKQILSFYELDLVHFPPNAITSIAIFVHLCEAFLGIPPQLELFRHLYRIKPTVYKDQAQILGGVTLYLSSIDDYISLPFKTSVRNWKESWFMVSNHMNSVPPRSKWKPNAECENWKKNL